LSFSFWLAIGHCAKIVFRQFQRSFFWPHDIGRYFSLCLVSNGLWHYEIIDDMEALFTVRRIWFSFPIHDSRRTILFAVSPLHDSSLATFGVKPVISLLQGFSMPMSNSIRGTNLVILYIFAMKSQAIFGWSKKTRACTMFDGQRERRCSLINDQQYWGKLRNNDDNCR
jgi:hypothetical protein